MCAGLAEHPELRGPSASKCLERLPLVAKTLEHNRHTKSTSVGLGPLCPPVGGMPSVWPGRLVSGFSSCEAGQVDFWNLTLCAHEARFWPDPIQCLNFPLAGSLTNAGWPAGVTRGERKSQGAARGGKGHGAEEVASSGGEAGAGRAEKSCQHQGECGLGRGGGAGRKPRERGLPGTPGRAGRELGWRRTELGSEGYRPAGRVGWNSQRADSRPRLRPRRQDYSQPQHALAGPSGHVLRTRRISSPPARSSCLSTQTRSHSTQSFSSFGVGYVETEAIDPFTKRGLTNIRSLETCSTNIRSLETCSIFSFKTGLSSGSSVNPNGALQPSRHLPPLRRRVHPKRPPSWSGQAPQPATGPSTFVTSR